MDDFKFSFLSGGQLDGLSLVFGTKKVDFAFIARTFYGNRLNYMCILFGNILSKAKYPSEKRS